MNCCYRNKNGIRFCIELWLAKKNVFVPTILSARNHKCVPVNYQHQRHNRTFMERRSWDVHLEGSSRYSVLWAAATVTLFKSSTQRKTPTIHQKTWQNYSFLWQFKTTCCKTSEGNLAGTWIECLTPPALFTRRCSFRLQFVSVDAACWAALQMFRRYQKMARWLDRLKRTWIFLRNPYVTRKVGKGCSCQRGDNNTFFLNKIIYHSFKIKHEFLLQKVARINSSF